MSAKSPPYDIVVLGGDGIGPEVCDQSVRLLRALEATGETARYRLREMPAGAGEYLRSGNALPDEVFEACENSDAILLGAMGLPDVRYPTGKEIAPQLDLRERLGLYGGVRPIRLYHPSDTPLKGFDAGEIDFVIVRESTEGLFYGRGSVADLDADHCSNEMRITRDGARRVCRLAFQWAKQQGRKRVTLIDKANVLSTMVYMRHFFDEVAKDFPDIEAEHVYVDASALFMVRDPKRFDVVVTENMFGDILSDLAAGLVGGMGMAPSGDLGDSAAVFQPSHGSAPDIAGRGIANPIAMHLSLAMMLRWLGDDFSVAAADAIDAAVSDIFEDAACRTGDMGGSLGTVEITDRLIEAATSRLSIAAT